MAAAKKEEIRSLGVSSPEEAKAAFSDLIIVGEPDTWIVVAKASSESAGFMKTTKKMAVPGGSIYQMETQQKAPDGSWALSQSSVFVPTVR
jgi:hypothetical protein